MQGRCIITVSLTIEEDGERKKTRRSYASIAGSRATWLWIVRRPRANHQPQKTLQKKALKAIWDSESETVEEVDTAHVCFIANDNTPKVTSEPSLDDCKLTIMDKLGEIFEELSNNYDFLKKNYLKLKKENETLHNKIIIF